MNNEYWVKCFLESIEEVKQADLPEVIKNQIINARLQIIANLKESEKDAS